MKVRHFVLTAAGYYYAFNGDAAQIWHFVSVVRVPTRKFLNAKSLPEELTVDVRNLDYSRPIGNLDLGGENSGGDVGAALPMRSILSSVDFQVPPGLKVFIHRHPEFANPEFAKPPHFNYTAP